MSGPSTLKMIAEFAQSLDTQEFADTTSKQQRTLLRTQADELRKVLGTQGLPITADTLIALTAGAALQASMTANRNPLQKTMSVIMPQEGDPTQADGILLLLVAYLARDILTGRRIE